MSVLFGGDACPLGLSVQFLEASEHDVIDAMPRHGANMASAHTRASFPRSLDALLPFQAPWTRTLTASVGRWTAIANNGLYGGDSTAPGPAVMHRLGVRCVVATHAPSYGPGHAQTQLEVSGPSGEPPLMSIRTISASAADGRWDWNESGEPFPFEDTERYRGRVKHKRFDRLLLLQYLRDLGIPTDDSAYGSATLHQQQVPWPSREMTFDQARADFGY